MNMTRNNYNVSMLGWYYALVCSGFTPVAKATGTDFKGSSFAPGRTHS